MISLIEVGSRKFFETILNERRTGNMQDKNNEHVPEERAKNEDLASTVRIMILTFSSVLLIVLFSLFFVSVF
jgi:hypothetical protein